MTPPATTHETDRGVTLLAIGDVHLGTQPGSIPEDMAECGIDPRDLTPEAIREQIELVKNEPVNANELARIKAQVIAADVYQLDSVFYQAMKIGRFETVGLDWRLSDQYAERIQQVTAEQVQQVAKKYLIDDSLTVAVLEPQPMDSKQPRRPSAGGRH